MNNNNSKSFSIDYTVFIKGVAIILLVIHHYIGIHKCSVVDLCNTTFQEIIYNLCKVCVSIFAILSGYGMYKQALKYNSVIKLSIKRIILVLVGYWMAFVVWLIYAIVTEGSLSAVYRFHVVFSFVKDLFGMSHVGPPTDSINGVSWFIGALLVFYICFPILFWIMKKLNRFDWILVLVSAIPTILRVFNITIYSFDSIVYYIFAFVLGMFIAKRKIFDSIVNHHFSKIGIALATLGFIGFCCLRLVLGLVIDTIFALIVIIVLITVFKKCSVVDKVFMFFGREELFIYLFHTTVLSITILCFGENINWLFKIASFVVTLMIAILFSKIYLKIKTNLNSRFFVNWDSK